MLNLVPFKRNESASQISLDDLFTEARRFGRVNLFTMREGDYSVDIKFECVPGTELTASSGFHHETPHQALTLAIERAKEIRKAFK